MEKALKVGDKSTAFQYANKCLDVTTDLAYELILTLRSEGIDYLVAPYEADAQMAYLNKMGLVDAIITEDSDLILFGCQKVTKRTEGKSGGQRGSEGAGWKPGSIEAAWEEWRQHRKNGDNTGRMEA